MPVAEIMTAWNSLKAAGEIAKGLIDLKTIAEVQAKAIELNGKIIAAQHDMFAAQATQAALVEEVDDLKKRIVRMEDWDAQKKRYKLATVAIGTTVYALQRSMSGGEPAHCLCPNCYENGKRSILSSSQRMGPRGGMKTILLCSSPGCKAEIEVGGIPTPFLAKYAEDFAGA